MDIQCATCHSYIDLIEAKVDSGGDMAITVQPCSECLEEARKEAKEEGHDEGYDAGHEQGHGEGYDKGYEAGIGAEQH